MSIHPGVINQFQSYYDISARKGATVDFLLGKINYFDKTNANLEIVVEFSNLYNEKDKLLQEKLNKIVTNKTNFTIIPSYLCNMNCEYCYEGTLRKINKVMNIGYAEQIIKLLKAITKEEKDIEFTILGGEPIMQINMKFYDTLFRTIQNYLSSYKLNFITNGLEVKRFIKNLVSYKVTSCQMTLDGGPKIHNTRRKPLNSNFNSFDKICESVNCLLENNIYTFIRVNVDEENVNNLPELAEVIVDKKWNLSDKFEIYVYPISFSGSNVNKTYLEENALLDKVLSVLGRMPKEKRVFKLDFHGISFIEAIQNNRTPPLRFAFCDANKNQFVFDTFGYIYSCWWGATKNEFKIGQRIDGEYMLDDDKVSKWRNRNVSNIPECAICKFKYICGGGCGYKAIFRKGDLYVGNCAPFDKIILSYLRYLNNQ